MPIANKQKAYFGIIYSATNDISGKIYIGQTTKGLDERMRGHTKTAFGMRKNNMPICRAIKRYGTEHFIWDIIDYAHSREELNKKEIYYIQAYGSTNKNIGYNISSGGANGNNFYGKTEEEMMGIARRISNSLQNYYITEPFSAKKRRQDQAREVFGDFWKNASEEYKRAHGERISNRMKGVPKSEKTKLKISVAKTGVRLTDETIFRRELQAVHPVFTKERFNSCSGRKRPRNVVQPLKSEAKKGKHNPMFGIRGEANPQSKTIKCTQILSGESTIIHGIQEASRQLNIPATYICRVLKGKSRRTAYGYKFEYI